MINLNLLGFIVVLAIVLVAWFGRRQLAIGAFALFLPYYLATLWHHATDKLNLHF